MSKVNIYCLRDNKTGQFSQPINFINDGAFVRWASKFGSSGQIDFPEDQELYKLGSLETSNGEIVPDKQFIANLVDYLEVK